MENLNIGHFYNLKNIICARLNFTLLWNFIRAWKKQFFWNKYKNAQLFLTDGKILEMSLLLVLSTTKKQKLYAWSFNGVWKQIIAYKICIMIYQEYLERDLRVTPPPPPGWRTQTAIGRG